MGYDVRQKADIVGTHRFICVYLMETLARWVPTTPELEAKALFGRHLWDLAQHADQLGQRTAELRSGLHHNREPARSFRDVLESFAGTDVPFLSCQDLAVFKVFFNRTRDWADLEEMFSAGTLDVDAAAALTALHMGADDERVVRLRGLRPN